MIRMINALLVSAGLVAAAVTSAQADDFLEIGGWYEVLQIRFKPSCAGRAFAVIQNHFAPVDTSVGRHVVSFDFRTGEWDHMAFFPIAFTENGYDWKLESEWWVAFEKQEGGRDQAAARFAEFADCIEESRREVARLLYPRQSSSK